MRKYKLLYLLVLIALTTTFSCGKDDTPTTEELIVDKWWYGSSDNPIVDKYFFGSDGTFNAVIIGSEQGTWNWGPNDSLHLNSIQGGKRTLWLRQVDENNIKAWPTSEPFGRYYFYTTTEP